MQGFWLANSTWTDYSTSGTGNSCYRSIAISLSAQAATCMYLTADCKLIISLDDSIKTSTTCPEMHIFNWQSR